MLDPKDMYYVGYIMATITETCKLRNDCKDCPFQDTEMNSCMFSLEFPCGWDLGRIFEAFFKGER